MIRVGVAGWSYRDWEGIVYPRRKPRGFHGLEYLARFTDCMEINSSFYGMPQASSTARWVELTERPQDAPPFHFMAKLHQSFTHAPRLTSTELARAAETFALGVAPLRDSGRLAALLAQFPVTFHYSPANEARVADLRAAFQAWPLAIELRHKSWFQADASAFLRASEISTLHIDLPAAPDHPPQHFAPTGPTGYLRLHGRNSAQWFKKSAGRDERYNYLYDARELDDLQATALQLEQEHDEVYIISNNHFAGQAVANAIELRARLSAVRVSAPAELITRYPYLSKHAQPTGQQQLF